MWGDPLYKNRTVPGTVVQFQRYYKQLLAPAVTMFKGEVDACAARRCYGHGRCTKLEAGSGCQCLPGYDAATHCK